MVKKVEIVEWLKSLNLQCDKSNASILLAHKLEACVTLRAQPAVNKRVGFNER